MRTEADNNDDNDADVREGENGVEPEQFDISGPPAKEPEGISHLYNTQAHHRRGG